MPKFWWQHAGSSNQTVPTNPPTKSMDWSQLVLCLVLGPWEVTQLIISTSGMNLSSQQRRIYLNFIYCKQRKQRKGDKMNIFFKGIIG